LSADGYTPEQAEKYVRSLELFGMRFGLDRMRRLMTVLDSPQRDYESIHVTGTNGKSSTTRMIAMILSEHGVRAGSYLSPHIETFAQRVEVDGTPVSAERFATSIGRAAKAVALVERTLPSDDRVTQFEVLTAAAYWELAQRKIDVGVIEAGLGGRYDATSVIDSKVQVLTNVGLEHTRWLGPTERHIAQEKLAVVPEQGTLVAGSLDADALDVARSVARERGAELWLRGRDFDIAGGRSGLTVTTPGHSYGGLHLRALGRFQQDNFAAAVTAAEAFHGPLDVEAVRRAAGLRLPGRLERVGSDPLVLHDGAHNASGMDALVASLGDVLEGRRLIAVVSILDDKDATAMLRALLPACDRIVFTRAHHERALSPATLESLSGQLGADSYETRSDPRAALERAVELAGPGGAVLATGSIYLLSDLAGAGRTARLAEG